MGARARWMSPESMRIKALARPLTRAEERRATQVALTALIWNRSSESTSTYGFYQLEPSRQRGPRKSVPSLPSITRGARPEMPG
jgi:hypothetical protein